MARISQGSRWARFWERGTSWKAIVAAVGYLAVYQLAGLADGRVFGNLVDGAGPLASETNVFVYLLVPLLVGAIVLVAFVVRSAGRGRFSPRSPFHARAGCGSRSL